MVLTVVRCPRRLRRQGPLAFPILSLSAHFVCHFHGSRVGQLPTYAPCISSAQALLQGSPAAQSAFSAKLVIPSPELGKDGILEPAQAQPVVLLNSVDFRKAKA